MGCRGDEPRHRLCARGAVAGSWFDAPDLAVHAQGDRTNVIRQEVCGVPQEAVSGALASIGDTCTLVDPRSVPRVVKEDPDDDHILACAREGEADAIVTGDMALLDIRDWEGIRVVTIREMLDELGL